MSRGNRGRWGKVPAKVNRVGGKGRNHLGSQRTKRESKKNEGVGTQ